MEKTTLNRLIGERVLRDAEYMEAVRVTESDGELTLSFEEESAEGGGSAGSFTMPTHEFLQMISPLLKEKEQEIERLREALREIAAMTPDTVPTRKPIEVAREALTEPSKTAEGL